MDKFEELITAHTHCFDNKNELQVSAICGCFYCLKIFSPQIIEEYIEEGGDDYSIHGTAICPYCSIDSIIGESSGFSITKEFLKRMNRYWFESGVCMQLHTPFGNIKLILDGVEQTFHNMSIDPDSHHFPDVDAVHRISFDFKPDGKAHQLNFIISDCSAQAESETGERLEAVSFYIGSGKITLGCLASFGDYKDYDFDFDGCLIDNGIEIAILQTTQAQTFKFGVSWLSKCTKENDVQTWFGADPTM